jgi:hypothetical protein
MQRGLGVTASVLQLGATTLAFLSLISATALQPAAAVEVRCIEASRYRYLYQIFGGEAQRFAEYLQVGKARLPDPDMCRAVLVTGQIEPHRPGNPDDDPDFERLAQAIVANRGWLATLYLSSPGGTVGTAMRLAVLTRMFWLKTYAPGGTFLYVPDFLAPPDFSRTPGEIRELTVANRESALFSGWDVYAEAVRAHARVELPLGARARCTSACTYPLVAGIDRHGTPFVHRGRRATPHQQDRSDGEASIADAIELLQRSEARVVALYRHMDAGEEIIRLYQSTAMTAVSPAPMTRSPRFLADHLRQICKIDVNTAPAASTGQTEQCIAAAHERERLRQFARLCGESCSPSMLLRAVRSRLQTLFAEAPAGPVGR